MTQEERVLQHQCELLSKKITEIISTYKCDIEGCSTVINQLVKAENRSKEYENGTFIVLVVGPVKSGKSTLVNLIANAYVSPTHFLECTVRPSIISQKREGEDCKIVVYSSENKDNRIEQIDSIIDCLRGMDQESALEEIKKGEFELTRQNIKERVELDLKSSFSDLTLVTSITTPGGALMKQDIFIVDMPGFDGEYASIDDPVYDTIAQRADLIIFVQSSNSAISKVSGQFLQKLSENNKDVPVCLIHNIFDSAHWRSEEIRRTATLKQRDFAINEIRRQGFNIDDKQCFSINLGKVEDSRSDDYCNNTDLQKEAVVFENVESELYNRVINHRDAIRLKVCQDRTRQQLQKVEQYIREELMQRKKRNEQYKDVVDKFDKIRECPEFITKQKPVSVDFKAIKEVIEAECQSHINLIQTEDLHKTNSEAKILVLTFIASCEDQVSASFHNSLSLDSKEDELYNLCYERILEIQSVIQQCGGQYNPLSIEKLHLETLPTISLEPGVNLSLVIPNKVKIPGLPMGGHTSHDIISYINTITQRLVGTDDIPGYIETQAGAIQPILSELTKTIKNISKQYEDLCKAYLAKSEESILSSIIPDKESFDKATIRIADLNEKIKPLIE